VSLNNHNQALLTKLNMNSPSHLSRRQFLKRTTQTTALLAGSAALAPLLAAPETRRFRIGACDWSIGKMADPSGFELARKIGLDGLQVSLGSAASNMELRQSEVQSRFLAAAKQNNVPIASLAIGELNNIPYKSDPKTIEWVSDAIDVCRALGCRVILLAFFYKNDLKNDKAGTEETVRRLKEVAPKAEKAGVILGLESWLSADEHLDIINRVGSPALQVYYDVANSTQMGYDIYKEIRQLGQKFICELHMKENGFLLGQGKVDFKKVRAALDDIDYTGWMQIEGAVPSGQPMFDSYVANVKFLRQIFSA
jgi:L-ribulose-5-phosphate 3-epimerase